MFRCGVTSRQRSSSDRLSTDTDPIEQLWPQLLPTSFPLKPERVSPSHVSVGRGPAGEEVFTLDTVWASLSFQLLRGKVTGEEAAS